MKLLDDSNYKAGFDLQKDWEQLCEYFENAMSDTLTLTKDNKSKSDLEDLYDVLTKVMNLWSSSIKPESIEYRDTLTTSLSNVSAEDFYVIIYDTTLEQD